MLFSKSLKPPALSNYLLVDKNHNLHLAIPLIGGAYIGTDNTCQTAKALKQFFGADPTHTNTATHQLNEYKKQLELQLFFYQIYTTSPDENKRSIIQKQLKQIGLLLTGIENIKQHQDFQNIISGHFPTLGNSTQDFLKTTNLCSISLRPFALDIQGTPGHPLFSTDRDQRYHYFGSSVRNIDAAIGNFLTESLAKSLAIKVKNFEYKNEANFITEANRYELFQQFFEAQSSLSYDKKIIEVSGLTSNDYFRILDLNSLTLDANIKAFLNTNKAKINFVLDQIFMTLKSKLIIAGTKTSEEADDIIINLKTKASLEKIITYTHALLGELNGDTTIGDFVSTILNEASTSIEKKSFTPFYTDNISLTYTTEEDAKSKMMLSIKLQFFLAQINIFLHDNELLKTEGEVPNFGKILDENQTLQAEFIAIISEKNFREEKVEEEIFKFIEENFKQFKINSNGTLGGGLFSVLSRQTFKFSDDHKSNIIKLFTRNFDSIKGSPHYDNFWILSEKQDGKVFSKGGNICVDFENLASHFNIQSHLIDPSNLDGYQPLTCQINNVEPANVLDDSTDEVEFVEISDDVLWGKIKEKLTELKRDSIQDALRFLKIKHEDKYFFENKATELKTFLQLNPNIKKSLLLLANQEFKEDEVLLDKFLETINPQQKQIILTKDELRALYTTFASDDFATIYSTGKYKGAVEELVLDDNPINGFETVDDIKKILKQLFDTQYFEIHKTKNIDHYPAPHASMRAARFIEGPVYQAPQNPPELNIDQLQITTSSFSAYISVNQADHAQLDKFLKHIIKLNKNKLYIPSNIIINEEVKNDSIKIYQEANRLNPGWNIPDISDQQLKLQRALGVCGINLPLDNIQFSGRNGYTIKFTNDAEARRIEEIIYPPVKLLKSSSALIYQLVNHLCSREISNQLNDLVNGNDFKKIKFALKALGINHFGNFNYNGTHGTDGFLIRVDPKIKKFFDKLNDITFNLGIDADYRAYQSEAVNQFTSKKDAIKQEFEKLTSLLIGFEEKCLFGEFDSSKFSPGSIPQLHQLPAEKKQEVIKIDPLTSCKYQGSSPKPSNEKKIRIYCPTIILNSFKELLNRTEGILGSTIKNPYDDTDIEIPTDSNDLTAYHLHILARNESANCDGVMNVGLYKGLLTPNEIAQLRCLVKATSLICFTKAEKYGGYHTDNIAQNDDKKPVIIIDQSGLQWQGDHRNTGGLFFYPTNKNDPNLSGGDDGAKFSEWQNMMYEKMYQRKRPANIDGTNQDDLMDVTWKGVAGKIHLGQLALGIKEEFLQAFASAVNSSDLINDDKEIYFKFLKAGMGFFAEGIGAQYSGSPNHKKISKARLKGIIMGLEELNARMPKGTTTEEKEKFKKQIFKKVDVIEFPFSHGDGRGELIKIKDLIESLGLKYVEPTTNDALKRHSSYENHIIATTNTGDPHALAGNEGGHQSVDASIATNLENSNCLNPLINPNFQTNTQEITIKSSQKAIIDFEETTKSSGDVNYKIFTPTLNFQGIKYQDERFSFISRNVNKTKDEVFNLITAGLTKAKEDLEQEQTPIPAKFFLAVMQISSYNQGVGSMKELDLTAQLKELLGDSYEERYSKLAIKFSAQFQKKMTNELLTSRQLETSKLNTTAMRLFRASTDENIEKFFNLIATAEETKIFSELLQNNYKKLSALTPSKNHKIRLTSATGLETKTIKKQATL